jgi:hypothetical protein
LGELGRVGHDVIWVRGRESGPERTTTMAVTARAEPKKAAEETWEAWVGPHLQMRGAGWLGTRHQ